MFIIGEVFSIHGCWGGTCWQKIVDGDRFHSQHSRSSRQFKDLREKNMKFARFEFCGSISFGIVEDDIVKVISSTPFDDFDVLDQIHHISEIQLLAPTVPSIIFFMGGNYMDHLGEGEPPVVPQVYTKTPNSIIGPNDTIIVPSHAGHVQEEAELVARIMRE